MNKKNSIIILSIILIQLFSYNTNSVEPDEILQNKNQESRARNISQNIRCILNYLCCLLVSLKMVRLNLFPIIQAPYRSETKKRKKEIQSFVFLRKGN